MLTSVIVILILLGIITWQIYPAISAPHTSDYMIEEDSPSYMKNEEKSIEKLSTNDNFIEKEKLSIKEEIKTPPIAEEFQKTKGGRQLTEHIAEVIELNPNSKKRLTKRECKIVDKIVKDKK